MHSTSIKLFLPENHRSQTNYKLKSREAYRRWNQISVTDRRPDSTRDASDLWPRATRTDPVFRRWQAYRPNLANYRYGL